MTNDRSEESPDKPTERTEQETSEGKPPRRPTPVRELMETDTAPADALPSDESDEVRPEPVRTLEVADVTWTVRVEGATRSGSGQDAGAPLLFLSFTREADEDGGAEGQPEPEREALAVGASLDDLSDHALAEVFSRSRPYRAREG